jgi:hypothetical protein
MDKKQIEALLKPFSKATAEQIASSKIFQSPRLVELVKNKATTKVVNGILLSAEPRSQAWENKTTKKTGFKVGFPIAVNYKGVTLTFLLKPDNLTAEMLKNLEGQTVKFTEVMTFDNPDFDASEPISGNNRETIEYIKFN